MINSSKVSALENWCKLQEGNLTKDMHIAN